MNLKTHGSLERTLTPQQAVEIARAICAKLGFQISLEEAGLRISSWTCQLTNDHDGYTTIGRGKGLGEQSLASAIFEALEHLIYERENLNSGPILALDLSGTDQNLCDASPDFHLICNNRSIMLTRLQFTSFSPGTPNLMLPAFLTNPLFESLSTLETSDLTKFGLLRYSTNSGTASGLKYSDAVLHALLETIERDAIGLTLLETVLHRNPKPVRRLRPESLPEALQMLCHVICSETKTTLEIWEITSDTKIPVVLAALLSHTGSRRYFGSGCSLSPSYAIERAVLEAVQSLHTYEVFNSPSPLFGQTNFKESTLFQGCYLEAGHFSYRGGIIEKNFAEMMTLGRAKHLMPDQQMKLIIDRLSSLGLQSYKRVLWDSGFYVVQVSVPQFDRFHLVSQGIPIAPAKRGRAVLRDHPASP